MSATTDQPDYSLLTPEEIEAMNAEPSPDELVTMRQAKEAENLDENDDDQDQDADDKPVEKDQKPVETKTEKTEDIDDKPADPEKPAPRFESKLPDDFEDQVKAIKDKRAQLRESYKNGEIDFDEFEEKREAIDEEQKALDRVALKAEIAKDMNEQTAEQLWAAEVSKFMSAALKSDGIDYNKDAAKNADLDLFVKRLASDPANAEQPMDWFLQEAHKRVKALHGIETKPESKKPDTRRKPSEEMIPKTLANVPGGDDAAEVDSKFAELDKLDGLKLETALAKLSPEQRQAYLAGA